MQKRKKYLNHFKAEEVKQGFKYNSGTNEEWETVESMRERIKRFVSPEFKPL